MFANIANFPLFVAVFPSKLFGSNWIQKRKYLLCKFIEPATKRVFFLHETGKCKYHNVMVTSSHEIQQQQQQRTTRKYRVSSSLSLLHEAPCWESNFSYEVVVAFFRHVYHDGVYIIQRNSFPSNATSESIFPHYRLLVDKAMQLESIREWKKKTDIFFSLGICSCSLHANWAYLEHSICLKKGDWIFILYICIILRKKRSKNGIYGLQCRARDEYCV